MLDLGATPTTADERAFLAAYYRNGLGEFAYRNGIDLQGLEVVGPEASRAAAVDYVPGPLRPLIPFGGGIDSIVTVAWLTQHVSDAALCVVHPPGERFDAIEERPPSPGSRSPGSPARSIPSSGARKNWDF